jgi:pyruvate decarboxylase
LIHGLKASYNDIQPIRHTELPHAFGAKEGQSKTWSVKTKAEFEALLKDEELANGKGLRLVEVFMDEQDAPKRLVAMSDSASKLIGGH